MLTIEHLTKQFGEKTLARDPEKTKAFGEAGYQRIITHYTIEKYVQNLTNVFQQVIDK